MTPPGASRGLGRKKPHVELHQGVWHAFDIVEADGAFMGGVIHRTEVINNIGSSSLSWLEALRYWKASQVARSLL